MQCMFQQSLAPVNTFTVEECSKKGAYVHWSNHISRGQELPKYLSYEADPFFQSWKKFL